MRSRCWTVRWPPSAGPSADASAKEARRVMREAKKAERAKKHAESKERWDERLAALKRKMTGEA